MGNYLNIGNEGFKTIRNGRYIDKTGMISLINRSFNTPEKMICVSRPRRFGKSFAVKMLGAYYDKSCDSRELFQGLEISRDNSFGEHLNKYDVISIDMTLMITNVRKIENVVSYVSEKIVMEVKEAYPTLKVADSLIETLASAVEISGSKFIILIDEWDALFREAKNKTAIQDEYIKFLRSLFKSNLTDKAIHGAYMTGILPIKKYGTQSAMTDFQEYSMLRPGPYKNYVGFTEKEVRNLFANSELSFEDARKWYDGYSFGNDTHIYSPKSVVDALRFEEFGNYWTQSETYEALRMYIDMDLDGLKEAIVEMLSGKACKINPLSFQNDMTTIKNKDDVLTLLVHLGYLAYHSKTQTVSIPNEEVRIEFLNAVQNGSHRELAKLIQHSDLLLQQTIAGNEEAVAAAIEKVHSATTAPIHYNNEQALRSVIRFAYISCMDEYLEIQELPGGNGYADIVFMPKKESSKPLMIIELKWNKTAECAVSQIKKQKYPEAWTGYGSQILLVGIDYDVKSKRHSCRIEEYKGRAEE